MPITSIILAVAMLVTPVASSNSAVTSDNASEGPNSATSMQTVLAVAGTDSQSATVAAAPAAAQIDQDDALVNTTSVGQSNAEAQGTTKDIVKAFYKDMPILAEIAFCESTYHQFDADGDVFRGKVNTYDVGVMQINELYHGDEAQKMGYDLYTLQGNLAFAKWLYDHEGTAPWDSSKGCWGHDA